MIHNKKFDDVRDATHQARKDIGFLSDFHLWKEAPAHFTKSDLYIEGHPVMERWEESYMDTLASIASRQGGDVLEVGFGMGISARCIQKNKIRTHTLIEANADVYQHLLQFAENESTHTVLPLFGFWQEITPQLSDESFDGILFDTYPLSEDEVHRNHFPFFEEAYRLLRPGGVLTYYSDEIDSFSQEHIAQLQSAGFTDIDLRVCAVNPPDTCAYWKSPTIIAPIITK